MPDADDGWPVTLDCVGVLPKLVLPVLPVLLCELPVLAALWEVVAVSAVVDFLLLFMSPSANAEPLASATTDVTMNAGAILRMWDSFER